MKNVKIFLTSLVLVLFTMSSCEKEQEQISNYDLLTAHVWYFVNITTNTDDPDARTFVYLYLDSFEDCIIEFCTDDTYIFYANSNKDVGTWSLSPDDKIIYFDKGTPYATIIKLTDNELWFKEYLQIQNIESFDIIWSFDW